MDMTLLNQLAPNSLTRDDMKVDSDAPAEGTPNTFVDGRNMLFLTFAAVFAKQKGVTDILTGVSQSDFSGYPDCRDEFIKSLNVSLNLAMDYEFYNGIKGDGCGNCPACKLRKKGLDAYLARR